MAVNDKDYIGEEDIPLEFHFAQLEPQGSAPAASSTMPCGPSSATSSCVHSRSAGWNVTATSEYLGMPLSTLKYKMDKLDVRRIARRIRGN